VINFIDSTHSCQGLWSVSSPRYPPTLQASEELPLSESSQHLIYAYRTFQLAQGGTIGLNSPSRSKRAEQIVARLDRPSLPLLLLFHASISFTALEWYAFLTIITSFGSLCSIDVAKWAFHGSSMRVGSCDSHSASFAPMRLLFPFMLIHISHFLCCLKGTSPSKGEKSGSQKQGRNEGSKGGIIDGDEYRVTVIHTGEKLEEKDECLEALEKLKEVRFPSRRTIAPFGLHWMLEVPLTDPLVCSDFVYISRHCLFYKQQKANVT